jgi:hypothetical protein
VDVGVACVYPPDAVLVHQHRRRDIVQEIAGEMRRRLPRRMPLERIQEAIREGRP